MFWLRSPKVGRIEMHGLVNKALETFISKTYGLEKWEKIARLSGLDDLYFEAMMIYDSAITPRVIDAACIILGSERSDFLHSLGIFLVSHPSCQRVRRLLRFGGVDYVDFLYSLDDLRDRARLAVSDLILPRLELREHTSVQFSLTIHTPQAGYGHVIAGLLTAMADDYGALVMLEHGGRSMEVETIAIVLLDAQFATGNSFDLGARA